MKWTKKLPKSDAQRPTPGSNPTGGVRLTQAKHAINCPTWFRYVYFGGHGWWHEGALDVTQVYVNITILGHSFGVLPVRVSYKPQREAGQSNYTTMLHWPEQVLDYLRSVDVTDKYLLLNDVNGDYTLVVA